MLPMWMLLSGGAALVALTGKKTTAAKTPVGTPGHATPAQPSQKYPFTPNVPARVDNANQPWAPNPSAAQQSGTGIQSVGMNIGVGASIVHNLSDVWGDMSDVFGGNDAKQNLQSTDNVPAPVAISASSSTDQTYGPSEVYGPPLPASDGAPSDSVGQAQDNGSTAYDSAGLGVNTDLGFGDSSQG